MNILWITNIPLPEASELMNEEVIPFGGWMVSVANALSKQNNIKLSLAFPKNGLNGVENLQGDKINFYAFSPISKRDLDSSRYNLNFAQILEKVQPDVVHIFGTEFLHTLAMVNICNKKDINIVINIQGLVSICSKHYMACIPEKVQNEFTFRDFIRQDNLRQQAKKFAKRGEFEIEALQKVKHVIGRTEWDKACTIQINPNIEYHFCNETLRDEFYKHIWDIDKCDKYSIFISQASYPIKGLHFMLEAMPLILRRFPATKLYIAGPNMTKSDTLKEKMKMGSYAKYIKELIYKYDLQKNVTFTGLLDEKEMCERYLKSHVFACPSSIENSSNSLGEAMILGVPCIASYVGGVADLLKHGEEGFIYQTDAPYMLAHYICNFFVNDELAKVFSSKARDHARITHDPQINLSRLINIYDKIKEGRANT